MRASPQFSPGFGILGRSGKAGWPTARKPIAVAMGQELEFATISYMTQGDKSSTQRSTAVSRLMRCLLSRSLESGSA